MLVKDDTPPPYQKSLIDEIDFKIIDQLHGAVSQISHFCFEIKNFASQHYSLFSPS